LLAGRKHDPLIAWTCGVSGDLAFSSIHCTISPSKVPKGDIRMDPKLVVVSIWAQDVPGAVHFYRDILDMRLMPHHGQQPHFDLGGVYLTIVKGQPAQLKDREDRRFPVVAFAVDDLNAAVARLRAHRIDLPWGIEADVRSRWIMFHDPAGNLIELVEFTS
jgi:catechol 2,3-dioxygenase-like lactoylglutathione lyase family enzyme